MNSRRDWLEPEWRPHHQTAVGQRAASHNGEREYFCAISARGKKESVLAKPSWHLFYTGNVPCEFGKAEGASWWDALRNETIPGTVRSYCPQLKETAARNGWRAQHRAPEMGKGAEHRRAEERLQVEGGTHDL